MNSIFATLTSKENIKIQLGKLSWYTIQRPIVKFVGHTLYAVFAARQLPPYI